MKKLFISCLSLLCFTFPLNAAMAAGLFGKCGCVITIRSPAEGVLEKYQMGDMTASMILDFDAGTSIVAFTRQELTTGGYTWTQKVYTSKPFKSVIIDPDGLEGSYEITLNFTENLLPADIGRNPKFRIIPVNSGNTFLIQGKNFGTNGVCQKI
jgi:hypothetical protein